MKAARLERERRAVRTRTERTFRDQWPQATDADIDVLLKCHETLTSDDADNDDINEAQHVYANTVAYLEEKAESS